MSQLEGFFSDFISLSPSRIHLVVMVCGILTLFCLDVELRRTDYAWDDSESVSKN